MYLFQTKYKDKKTGEEKKCKTWYIAFKDHLEIEHRIAGDKNKDAATAIGKMIDRFVWYRKAKQKPDLDDLQYLKNEVPERIRTKLIKLNIIDKQAAGMTSSLQEYLEAYRDKLRTGFRPKRQGMKNTDCHVNTVHNEVKHIIEECGFKTWSDIHFDKVQKFLSNKDIAEKTFNYYVRDFEQFINWVIKSGREQLYPLGGQIARYVIHNDKEARRTLSDSEMETLVKSTAKAPDRYGLSGYERAVIYITAAELGFRASELKRLKVSDFDLKNGFVTMDWKRTKNRNDAKLPIRQCRIDQYRWFFGRKNPEDALFNFKSHHRYADMIKADLKDAEIEIKNEEGVQADFHSLKKVFADQVNRPELGLSDVEKDYLTRHIDSQNIRKYIYSTPDMDRMRKAVNQFTQLSWPSCEGVIKIA